jgi:hypothetical protein
MKRLSLSLMTIVAVIATACAGERVIPFEQLPQQAQDFTRTYFKAEDPLYRNAYVTYDPELFDSSYMVVFTNGDGLEFNKDGQWKDFDCTHCVVPSEIIPAPIQSYLSAKFPGTAVKKIEKNRRSYEVKLDGGLELEFDLDGNLKEIDD